MKFSRLSRKLHRWGAVVVGLPLLLVIGSGLLLQLKKQITWVQPAEQRTADARPAMPWEAILEAARAIPGGGVTDWTDIDRVDVRPGKGILKITTKNRWEAQMALGTGEVLQVAYRRSDLIETLHDGSFFGDSVKLWVFFPAGLVLFGLWLTGVYLWLLPTLTKRKRARLAAPLLSALLLARPATLDAQSTARTSAATYVPGATWESRTPAPRDMEESHSRSLVASRSAGGSVRSRRGTSHHAIDEFLGNVLGALTR